MNCCICGPVKNCGPYLRKVFENIEKIGSLFDSYQIVIFYDKSTDNTLEILHEYKLKNPNFYFFVNENKTSQFRTHNIAYARNFCLSYIKNRSEAFPYFIMMDFDNVNCKEINLEPLRKCLKREDWDGLSFNTSPKYYDIWALSIRPYYFSYVHFNHSASHNHNTMEDYIDRLLKRLPKDDYLRCLSSFNGFSIYRTNKFLNTYYDGRIRLDLLPKNFIDENSRVTRSKVIYKKYDNVDGRYEDCEHRSFHLQAIINSDARIMISPEVIFQ
jgi:glycosyltransferase involved in cell wall biosynthesis